MQMMLLFPGYGDSTHIFANTFLCNLMGRILQSLSLGIAKIHETFLECILVENWRFMCNSRSHSHTKFIVLRFPFHCQLWLLTSAFGTFPWNTFASSWYIAPIFLCIPFNSYLLEERHLYLILQHLLNLPSPYGGGYSIDLWKTGGFTQPSRVRFIDWWCAGSKHVITNVCAYIECGY